MLSPFPIMKSPSPSSSGSGYNFMRTVYSLIYTWIRKPVTPGCPPYVEYRDDTRTMRHEILFNSRNFGTSVLRSMPLFLSPLEISRLHFASDLSSIMLLDEKIFSNLNIYILSCFLLHTYLVFYRNSMEMMRRNRQQRHEVYKR